MTDAILQLFRNCKVDNDRHMSDFASLAEQNAYYSGLSKAQFSVRCDKVGEPILLSKPYNELLPYTYGRLSINGFWYYFSVASLDSESLMKTWLIYNIDCWETARYQMDARIRSARISRTSESVPTLTPYQPMSLKQAQVKAYSDFGYMLYIYESTLNRSYIGYIPGNQLDFESVLFGDFLSAYGLNPTDVKGMWLTPFVPNNLETAWILTGGEGAIRQFYSCKDAWNGLRLPIKVSIPQLYQKQTERLYITDIRGNEVFTPEIGKTYDAYFFACLDISATSCKWSCDIMSNGDHNPFTIACESIDVFSDAYAEYASRQRQIDIDTRRVQNQRQLIEGIASAGQSATFGSAGGAPGAVLGGLSSLAGSAVSYISSDYYGSKEQAITDATYRKARDDLSLTGSAMVSVNVFETAGVIKETWDEYTVKRVSDDVTAFGQYVSISTDNGEDYYRGVLTADVELDGMPDDWKAQVRARFNGGVQIG